MTPANILRFGRPLFSAFVTDLQYLIHATFHMMSFFGPAPDHLSADIILKWSLDMASKFNYALRLNHSRRRRGNSPVAKILLHELALL